MGTPGAALRGEREMGRIRKMVRNREVGVEMERQKLTGVEWQRQKERGRDRRADRLTD